jgi:hypothetical protein
MIGAIAFVQPSLDDGRGAKLFDPSAGRKIV